MNQHACFTVILGPYEDLKEPAIVPNGWDFYCFTDQDIKSSTWNIIKVIPDLPAQRMARRIKLLPHVYLPNYQYTFWLDASFRIDCNLADFWQRYFRSPLTAPAHPIRNCVYREIASCIANKRGDEGELERQRDAYKARKVKDFAQNIITSGVLMRENTDLCRRFCDAWWAELSAFSVRDQVAFAGIAADFPFTTFKWDYTNNKDLRYFKHFHQRH